MGSPTSNLLVNVSGVTYASVLCVVAAIFVLIKLLTRRSKLDAIPAVAPRSWFGAGFTFLVNGVDLIQEGYERYKSEAFKVTDNHGWMVILSNREHIEELRRAPEDVLSFGEAINDQLNTRYTLGDDIHDTPYHVAVIRSQLTQNIGTIYPEVRDEIEVAFDDVLGVRSKEWKSVLALNAVQRVVCRTTNRAFVGLPLCCNSNWINLNIQFTFNTIKTGFVIALFPKLIRSLIACFFDAVTQDIISETVGQKNISVDLFPQHKSAHSHLYQNDLLSWLMEGAEGPQVTVKSLTACILFVNFAAIHSFAHVLLYLAPNPQFIQPLCKEVEAIIEKEGWSKTALCKMHKVDSFLRECQRIKGMGALSVMRKAMKDFTFSDGTFISKGTLIGVATRSIHHDEKFYENPNVFEPFRFAGLQEEDEGGKYQFICTSMEYQPFGHGIHSCPGRFFAACEMKTMLAHLVAMYDVKLEDGATFLRSLCFGTAISPDPRAKVLFRRRVN